MPPGPRRLQIRSALAAPSQSPRAQQHSRRRRRQELQRGEAAAGDGRAGLLRQGLPQGHLPDGPRARPRARQRPLAQPEGRVPRAPRPLPGGPGNSQRRGRQGPDQRRRPLCARHVSVLPGPGREGLPALSARATVQSRPLQGARVLQEGLGSLHLFE